MWKSIVSLLDYNNHKLDAEPEKYNLVQNNDVDI